MFSSVDSCANGGCGNSAPDCSCDESCYYSDMDYKNLTCCGDFKHICPKLHHVDEGVSIPIVMDPIEEPKNGKYLSYTI